jgi:hypothetical protein
MLRLVVLVRTDDSGKRSAFIGFLRSVRRLLVTANVVPSSQIFAKLMMEALCSSETPVLTKATRHNIAENGILNTFHSWNWTLGTRTKEL